MKIDILMATYNGANYLQPQIESLLAQTEQDFRLIVRDDCSKDETTHLLYRASPRFGERMWLVPPGDTGLGPCGNFGTLLEISDAEYVMFCDQDDVWYPDKVSRLLTNMEKAEEMYGKDTPILIHSDARVVDADLNLMAASFQKHQKLKADSLTLSRLLVQNVVLGCSVIMNRKLVSLASPIPVGARMHDAWVALVAASCGKMIYLDAPLMDYRQHGKNAVGLGGGGAKKVSREFVTTMMNANVDQARALFVQVGNAMPVENARMVETFSMLPRLPRPMRSSAVLAGRFLREPWYHNVLVLALY